MENVAATTEVVRAVELQPVSLVFMDINMPILNGLETMRTLKKKFAQYDESRFIRPVLCYLSQMAQSDMAYFISKEEQADCYLEKPLPYNELFGLLQLLKIGHNT